MSERIRVPAGHARLFKVAAGQRFAVIAIEGPQVGDLIAFNEEDLTESLSTAHTRRSLSRVEFAKGDTLVTNLRRPMLTLIEDTVGKHDILVPPCDPRRYLLDFGITNHRNCLDNFVEALSPYKIEAWRIPNPINLFQNTRVAEDGRLVNDKSLAKSGGKAVFEANLNLIASLSSCPQDQTSTNDFRVKDLEIQIF